MLPKAKINAAEEGSGTAVPFGSGTASTKAKLVRTPLASTSSPALKKIELSNPKAMESPPESPVVSKNTSAIGAPSVRTALLGRENDAPASEVAERLAGVKTVEAPLKMPSPEMLTTGGGGDTAPKKEPTGTNKSNESTAVELLNANNSIEEFGPIPIVVKFKLFKSLEGAMKTD